MNKRNKIIVSIVGITIVLLALLGITYAYYLTRIEGNTNTNSISITTADLKIVYGDGNGFISASNITPGKDIEFKTSSGETTDSKTFTVTNSGNTTISGYGVLLEYTYIDGKNPDVFERPQDFRVEVTCESSIEGETCNGFSGVLTNENLIMNTNDIDPNEVHSYILKIYYDDPGVDQSNDMGKELNLKVQIFGVGETADIVGTLSGVESTYAVRLQSEPKISPLVNVGTKESPIYQYSFKGVVRGSHRLSVLDSSGDEIDYEYILIKNGEEATFSEESINVDGEELLAKVFITNENQRVVSLNTEINNSNGSSIMTNTGTSINAFNPYSSSQDTLAYNIINNSIQNKNDTIYSKNPLTEPLNEVSRLKYIDGGPNSSKWDTEYVHECQYIYPSNKYFAISDSFVFEDGKYTLVNSDGSPVQIVTGSADLAGMYSTQQCWGSSSSNITYTNKSTIYYFPRVDVENEKSYYIEHTGGYAANEKFMTYGDSYDFDEDTGTYTLKNSDGSAVKTVQYHTNYAYLIGKYIVDNDGGNSESPANYKKLSEIYLVSEESTSETIHLRSVRKSSEMISTEKTLSLTKDDYGDTYYYRGGNEDNYLEFAGMCWRIVRIEGDGSIKILLAKEDLCSSITDTDTKSALINNAEIINYGGHTTISYSSSLKSTLNNWFNSKISSTLQNYIKQDNWCLGGSTSNRLNSDGTPFSSSDDDYYYDTYVYYAYYRYSQNNVTLVCGSEDTSDSSKVGTLSMDEFAFAGGGKQANNSTYIYDNCNSTFWSLTYANSYYDPRRGIGDNAFTIGSRIGTSMVASTDSYGYGPYGLPARPSVTLISGIKLASGDGTKTNPYKIVTE